MTAPIGPRLDPFPWEERFFENTLETMALFDNPANDAVQCHIRLGGAGWDYAGPDYGSSFGPGLPEVGDLWGQVYTMPTKSEGVTVGVLDYLDAWAYTQSFENPIVKAAHETNDQWYWQYPSGPVVGATPVAGERVYPGVFTINPWGGFGYSEAVWLNQPISYEAWFATNENRSNPLMGFDGYTMFGDQSNACPTCMNYDPSAPADLYRRRFVCGVLKRTADLATCGPTDMMLGAIVTSDGTTTTVQLCLNGAIAHVETTPTRFGAPGGGGSGSWTIGEAWWESAWEGYASEIGVWPGFVDSFEVGISPAIGWFTISQWPTPGDPLNIPCFGYDTYDVKWAWYVDDYSPTHPVGTPFEFSVYDGFLSYSADPPNMYTGLPQLLPPQAAPDFWQDFVESRETTADVPFVPGQFLSNALALNPIIHFDFEAASIPADAVAYTPPINTIAATCEWDTGDDPNTSLIDGPIGKAIYDSAGGWWGIMGRSLPAVFDDLFFNTGFSIVKVLNHNSATGGYAVALMDLYISTLSSSTTEWKAASVTADIVSYDSSLPTTADVTLRVSFARSGFPSGPPQITQTLPVPFMSTDSWNVYAMTFDPSVAGEATVKLYVNGSELASGVFTFPTPISHSYGTFALTATDAYSDSGASDEHLIYNRVLTPAEIATLVL